MASSGLQSQYILILLHIKNTTFIISLKDVLEEEFPKWHLLLFPGDLTIEKPYDALLIRTFEKFTTKFISNN